MDFLIKGSCFGFSSSITILTLQVILGNIYIPAKTMINVFKASDMDIFKQDYLTIDLITGFSEPTALA